MWESGVNTAVVFVLMFILVIGEQTFRANAFTTISIFCIIFVYHISNLDIFIDFLVTTHITHKVYYLQTEETGAVGLAAS